MTLTPSWLRAIHVSWVLGTGWSNWQFCSLFSNPKVLYRLRKKTWRSNQSSRLTAVGCLFFPSSGGSLPPIGFCYNTSWMTSLILVSRTGDETWASYNDISSSKSAIQIVTKVERWKIVDLYWWKAKLWKLVFRTIYLIK